MCIERLYIIFYCCLLGNIVVLLVMFIYDEFYNAVFETFEIIVLVLSPCSWIIKICLVSHFYKMGIFFLHNLKNRTKINECSGKVFILSFGFIQIIALILDDFMTLTLCDGIFKNIQVINQNVATITIVINYMSAQVAPINSLFVIILITYFAKDQRQK